MFNNVRSEVATNKAGTVITSLAVAGGIITGIAKKKGFFGILGFAVGFGIAGLAISLAVAQISSKD